MNNPDIKPIKRSAALAPLSREHHETLLLAWKIRMGIKKDIGCARMVKYCRWFYAYHIEEHFQAEEKWIPGVLDAQDPLLLQMMDEHRLIRTALSELSENKLNCNTDLEAFAKLVNDHVRFEERILYNHIEKIATPEQLETFYQNHLTNSSPEWIDAFWLG